MPPPTPRRALPALLAAGLLSACATTGPRTAEPAPTPEPPHHPALAPFAHLAGVWRAPAGRGFIEEAWLPPAGDNALGDRESTRLHSSHVEISYAVICLEQ